MIDEKIFCVHGGLSPEHHSMDQVRRIARPTDVPDSGEFYFSLFLGFFPLFFLWVGGVGVGVESFRVVRFADVSFLLSRLRRYYL